MTRAGPSTLTVAISLLVLFSLPELACAQQPTAYGTWSGYFTYTETDYGTVIGEYSYAGMSTLTVDIFGSGPSPHGYYATLSGPPGFSGPGGSEGYELLSFCPTSASGLTEAGGYFGFYGSFDVTLPVHPSGWRDRHDGEGSRLRTFRVRVSVLLAGSPSSPSGLRRSPRRAYRSRRPSSRWRLAPSWSGHGLSFAGVALASPIVPNLTRRFERWLSTDRRVRKELERLEHKLSQEQGE